MKKTIVFVQGEANDGEVSAIKQFIGGEVLVLFRPNLSKGMEIHEVGVVQHDIQGTPPVAGPVPTIEFPPFPVGNVKINPGFKKDSVGTKITV